MYSTSAKAVAFHIKQWLRDGGLTCMPPDEVWTWIDAALEKLAWYAATFVPSILDTGATATSWGRELLVRYGDRQDVRNNLHANLSTQVWTGARMCFGLSMNSLTR